VILLLCLDDDLLFVGKTDAHARVVVCSYMMQATEYAMTQLDMDKDYHQCWADLGKHFTPDKK